MKAEDLFNIIGDADEKFVEDAVRVSKPFPKWVKPVVFAACLMLVLGACVFSALKIKNMGLIPDKNSDGMQGISVLTQTPDFSDIASLTVPNSDIYLKTPGAVSDIAETEEGIYLLAVKDDGFSLVLYDGNGDCLWEEAFEGKPLYSKLIEGNGGVYLFTDKNALFADATGKIKDMGDMPQGADALSACSVNGKVYFAVIKYGYEPSIYEITENGLEKKETPWLKSNATEHNDKYPLNLFTDGESLFVYYGYYDPEDEITPKKTASSYYKKYPVYDVEKLEAITGKSYKKQYPRYDIVKLDGEMNVAASLPTHTGNASSNLCGRVVNGKIYIDIGEPDDINKDYSYILYEYDTDLKLLNSYDYGYGAPMDIASLDENTAAVCVWLEKGKEISYIDILGADKKIYPSVTYPEIFTVDGKLFVVGVEGTDNKDTDSTKNITGLVISYADDFSKEKADKYTLGDDTGWEGRVIFTPSGKRLAVHSAREFVAVDVDRPQYASDSEKGEKVVRHDYITHPHISGLTPHYNDDGTYYYAAYPVKYTDGDVTMYLSRGVEFGNGDYADIAQATGNNDSEWCFFITAFNKKGELLYELSLGKSMTDIGTFRPYGGVFIYLDSNGYLTGYNSKTGEICWQYGLKGQTDYMIPVGPEVRTDAEGTTYFTTFDKGRPVVDIIKLDGTFTVFDLTDIFPKGFEFSSLESRPIESGEGIIALCASNRDWGRMNPTDCEGIFIRVLDKDMNVVFSKDFPASEGISSINEYGDIIVNPINGNDSYVYDLAGNELMHFDYHVVKIIPVNETRRLYYTEDNAIGRERSNGIFIYLVEDNSIINCAHFPEMDVQNVVPQNDGSILIAYGIHDFTLNRYDENLNLLSSELLDNNDHVIIISPDGEITVTAGSCH